MEILDILEVISELCFIWLMIIGVVTEVWFIAILGTIGFFSEKISFKLIERMESANA